MLLTDKLLAPSRGSVEDTYNRLVRNGARDPYDMADGTSRVGFLKVYLYELARLCDLFGFDWSILVAQAHNESDGFRSANYLKYGNTVGLNIMNDRNMSRGYRTGEEMARAHLIHIWIYVKGPIPEDNFLYPFIYLDPAYERALTGINPYSGKNERYARSVRILGDFNVNGIWAYLTDIAKAGPYGSRILERGNLLFGDEPQGVPEVPTNDVDTSGNKYGLVPMPDIVRDIVAKPSHTGSAYGYDYVSPRSIIGGVHHETMGSGGGAWLSDFFSCPGGERCSNALVDFAIDKNGRITMLNDPLGRRSPWASGGGVGSPGGLEGDGPAFVAKYGVAAINARNISIEYVKLDNENFTEAQIQSGGALMAYYHDQARQPWQTHPYVPELGIVVSFLHYEFGTTSCGMGEQDDISKVQAVSKGIMKRYQTGSGGVGPIPPVVDPLPPIVLPGGISLEQAKARFGRIRKLRIRNDQLEIIENAGGFDPKGIISLAWAHECAKRGLPFDQWPGAGTWYVLPETESGFLDTITWKDSDLVLQRKNEKASFLFT